MTDRLTGKHRTTVDMQDDVRWINNSGESVPAHGVIQLRTDYAASLNQASKPNGSAGLFYVNGGAPVAAGLYGESKVWGQARLVLIDGSPTVGDEVGPVSGQWYMSAEGSGYRVMHQAVGGIGAVVQVGGGGGSHHIWFTIISVECVSATEMILTVEPTWYTGGCTASVPGEDSYGYVEVEDVCEILLFYTATWLVGKTGRATYMYPRTGTCTAKWLVDTICGTPECD
jgi:hypothetical protein